MKIFNCILGVFAIFGAIFCIFFPGLTFLNGGFIITMLLGVWGICAIFDYATNRKNPEKSKQDATMGVLGLACGIAAAVMSIMAIFTPALRAVIDVFVLGMFSGWLIMSGVNSVITSVKVKKTGSKIWILSLICGIIIALAGFYGIFHMVFLARAIGYLIGYFLMLYGIRLICSVFEKN